MFSVLWFATDRAKDSNLYVFGPFPSEERAILFAKRQKEASPLFSYLVVPLQ